MVPYRLGERTEDHPHLGQLLLEGRGHRHRVDDGVDRHAAEPLLLGQRDTQLVEHGPNLGVDLVQAGQLRLRFRGRVVDDVLIVDRPVVDVLPPRLLQRDPVPVGPQTPLDQPVRLPLLRRDQPNDILAQPLRNPVGVQVGRKTIPVLLAGELPDLLRNARHARRPTTRQPPTICEGNPRHAARRNQRQSGQGQQSAPSRQPGSRLDHSGLLLVVTTIIAISLPARVHRRRGPVRLTWIQTTLLQVASCDTSGNRVRSLAFCSWTVLLGPRPTCHRPSDRSSSP